MGKYFTIKYSARGYIAISGNGISKTVEMSAENKRKLTDATLWEREINRLESIAISEVRKAMRSV